MNWPRYCVVLEPGLIRRACEIFSGFGTTLVTGWKDGQRCIWTDDKVTLTKFVMFFGCSSELIDRE